MGISIAREVRGGEGVRPLATRCAMAFSVGAAAPRRVEMVPFRPVFRADRPFLFLLRDTKSVAILFLGRVLAPKAKAG